MNGRREITEAAWRQEGERLFGKNMMEWKFVCPSCGYVASVQDWKDVGASEGEIAFSCVGRHTKNPGEIYSKDKKPCNYAGGGLFLLNPVHVELEDGHIRETFEFAKGGD